MERRHEQLPHRGLLWLLEARRTAGRRKIAGRRRGQCGRSEVALDWGRSGQSVGMEEGAIVPASLHTGMEGWRDGCFVLRQLTAVPGDD